MQEITDKDTVAGIVGEVKLVITCLEFCLHY